MSKRPDDRGPYLEETESCSPAVGVPDQFSIFTGGCAPTKTRPVSMTLQELQKLLDERDASRASRRRAWENLQEIRWIVKDACGIELPPPAKKTIDLEGRLVKDVS